MISVKNKCLRTFLDINISPNQKAKSSTIEEQPIIDPNVALNLEMERGNSSRRINVGNTCEKGSVENIEDMRGIKKEMDATIKSTPNLIDSSIKRTI